MLQLTQSSTLSSSCSRLLLQITSSLLLGENVTLPKSLIQEMIQKVGPWSLKIKFHLCVWEVSYMWRMWISLFFFTQDFQQHVRTRSDPGIHEGDVHYERIWTGESWVCLSFSVHLWPDRLHPPPALPSHLVALRRRLVPLQRFLLPQLWP